MDLLRSTVTGEDLQWVNTTFSNVFEEYNMIRKTNPQITITLGQMPASQQAAPSQTFVEAAPFPQSQMSQPTSQPQPLFPLQFPSNESQPNPEPFVANPPVEAQAAPPAPPAENVANAGTGSDFMTRVSAELNDLDEKYKMRESLKESYDRGVANVKAWFAEKPLKDRMSDGLHDTKQWLHDNVTADNVARGLRSASFVVIRGAVKISAGISDGLRRLLARMESAETNREAGNANANANANTAALLDPAHCLESPAEGAAMRGETVETGETGEIGETGNAERNGAVASDIPANPMPVNQSPMNQPMNQSPMNQPMNQSPMNQSMNQPPMNPSMNQSMNQPPLNQLPANQLPVSQLPLNQLPGDAPVNQFFPASQSVNQPAAPAN